MTHNEILLRLAAWYERAAKVERAMGLDPPPFAPDRWHVGNPQVCAAQTTGPGSSRQAEPPGPA